MKSIRLICSLGIRYFIWICTISVSLLNIGQFLENAWWSTPQWQHLTSVLVPLSLLCTRRYRFMASFQCVSVSKTCLAAHRSFIIIVNFNFCLFSRETFESRWFFFFESQQNLVEVVFLVFIQFASCTSERLYSFFSSLPQSSISGMLQFWMQIRVFLWLILSQTKISTPTFSWNFGEHRDFIVGRSLFSFPFVISIANSDPLFDLMKAGQLPISWVRIFSIAHGFEFSFIFWIHFVFEMCRV